jgi:hypothetical protein
MTSFESLMKCNQKTYENYKEEYYSQLQYATSSSTDLHHRRADNNNYYYYYHLPSFNEWIGHNYRVKLYEMFPFTVLYAISVYGIICNKKIL